MALLSRSVAHPERKGSWDPERCSLVGRRQADSAARCPSRLLNPARPGVAAFASVYTFGSRGPNIESTV